MKGMRGGEGDVAQAGKVILKGRSIRMTREQCSRWKKGRKGDEGGRVQTRA
jgi:hypothetical protein